MLLTYFPIPCIAKTDYGSFHVVLKQTVVFSMWRYDIQGHYVFRAMTLNSTSCVEFGQLTVLYVNCQGNH